MAEYIEREAIEYPYMTMTLWGLNQSTCHAYNEGVKAAADAIAAIPAADVVEVKRGRWIWDDNAMDWGLGGWVCSECQEKNDNIPAKPDINPYGWVGSFYCPNCGADMMEVNDAN